MKKKVDWKRYFPVTVEYQGEMAWLTAGWILSSLFSLLFLFRFYEQWTRLFNVDPSTGIRTIREGAMMPPFFEILSPTLSGFILVATMLVGITIFHYLSHYLDSKAIYTMKRLPDPFELHRRCLSMPAAGIVISFLIAALLMGLYLLIYYAATPSVCLPADWLNVPGL